jgi:hypothetical protein
MIRHQKGLTAISWVLVIAIISVQGVLAMRIVPVYMEYGSVKSIMDGLGSDPIIKGKTPKALRKLINKRLSINNIYTLQDNKDAFRFKKASTGTNVIVKYEARGPIFNNLEFVATFEYEVFLAK